MINKQYITKIRDFLKSELKNIEELEKEAEQSEHIQIMLRLDKIEETLIELKGAVI